MQELKTALKKAAKYFEKRCLNDWSFETIQALEQLEQVITHS